MIDFSKLREEVNDQRIIEIMKEYGVENFVETNDYFIFPTICHNIKVDEASMKLYYYRGNKLFHCYTECSDSFDIFGLIKKIHLLRGEDLSYYEIINIVFNGEMPVREGERYISEMEKYLEDEPVVLKKYDKGILNIFDDYLPIEWEEEGLTDYAIRPFEVKFSSWRNKIIIPHFDIEGNLVGIRGRALNPEEVAAGKKYMPLTIENTIYRHPTSCNLYGLNVTKKAVAEMKKIILFEGEKSVMKMYAYKSLPFCAAVCGHNLSRHQIKILIENFSLNEIIVAFDKEYEKYGDKESENYFNFLYEICSKYKNYANISFIFDRKNLLERKDSPVDKGYEVFHTLYNERVVVE